MQNNYKATNMNTATDGHTFQEETGLSRVEYAYRKIKTNISTNVFAAGFQVLEPELANLLGVSRTPVREALIRLEADRLIKLIPRRGMRVIPLKISDILELNELIVGLQSAVLGKVCSASDNGVNIVGLDESIAALEKAKLSKSKDEWIEAEEHFFFALIELAGNSRLKGVVLGLFDQLRRAKYVIADFIQDKSLFIDIYRQLRDAIAAGNESLAEEHLASYKNALLKLFNDVEAKYQLEEF